MIRCFVKSGDLVKLGFQSASRRHSEEFGVVLHVYDVDDNLVHLVDYYQAAEVLCEDGVWTMNVDDLEVVNEAR